MAGETQTPEQAATQAAIAKVDAATAAVANSTAVETVGTATAAPEVKTEATTPAAEVKTEETTKAPEDQPKFDPFFKEFAETGALSDESFAALEKMGLPRNVVEAYAAGVQALNEKAANEAFDLVGGKDQYAKMADWARTNLSQADREAYDASVQGTQAQQKQAILALKAQYEATFGGEPTLLRGRTGAAEGAGAFASRAEMSAAMRDQRYGRDPAYRADVARRISLMSDF